MESVEKPTCSGLVDKEAVGCVAATTGLMSLDSKLPFSLGAAFGFVDTIFSLLALEEDKLPTYLKTRYEQSGVPFLNKEDIFADTSDLTPSVKTALFQKNEFNIPMNVMPEKTEIDLFSNLTMNITNGTLTISFGEKLLLDKDLVEITVFSLSGKVIAKERLRPAVSNGNLRVLFNGAPPQTVIVTVKIGKNKISRVIHASRI
jgi:hypothetical protein